MTKSKLVAKTTVGEFTRETFTAYSHVVVWESPRAAADVAARTGKSNRYSGVSARWAKDRGYGVTWHISEQSASKTARRGYLWDRAAKLVGVFPVEGSAA